jgi:hypothetical protein
MGGLEAAVGCHLGHSPALAPKVIWYTNDIHGEVVLFLFAIAGCSAIAASRRISGIGKTLLFREG